MIPVDFDLPSGAEQILRTLTAAGHEAYFVGGCVRDLLRGAPPHDWDICTSAHPEETAACFPGSRVLKTGIRHGTVTVLTDGVPYEITTWRAEGPYSDGRRPDHVYFVDHLEQDLARRDFTVNAIALGLDGTLRDPFGGADDVKAGRIRCAGEPARRFQEDGVRIMRALRFAAVLGYRIENRTARAIHDCRAMLDRVAAERIRAELCALLTGQNAGEVLRQYPDVLRRFWPELEPLTAAAQNDRWEHSLRALEAAPADTAVRLAVLLRDVGTSEQLLRRLKFDNVTLKRAATLTEYSHAPLPRDGKDIRRWLSRLGPETFFQLLEVWRADMLGQAPLGQVPENAATTLGGLAMIKTEAEKIVAEGQCFSLKDLSVNGRDVIAAGAVPGPAVGRVLDRLLERVLDGELPNRREVLLEHIRQELSAS